MSRGVIAEILRWTNILAYFGVTDRCKRFWGIVWQLHGKRSLPPYSFDKNSNFTSEIIVKTHISQTNSNKSLSTVPTIIKWGISFKSLLLTRCLCVIILIFRSLSLLCNWRQLRVGGKSIKLLVSPLSFRNTGAVAYAVTVTVAIEVIDHSVQQTEIEGVVEISTCTSVLLKLNNKTKTEMHDYSRTGSYSSYFSIRYSWKYLHSQQLGW